MKVRSLTVDLCGRLCGRLVKVTVLWSLGIVLVGKEYSNEGPFQSRVFKKSRLSEVSSLCYPLESDCFWKISLETSNFSPWKAFLRANSVAVSIQVPLCQGKLGTWLCASTKDWSHSKICAALPLSCRVSFNRFITVSTHLTSVHHLSRAAALSRAT